MAISYHAYCGRDGTIRIGRAVPAYAKPIAEGSRAHLRRAVVAFARHGYDGKTYLVPGIPEADSREAALEALERFREGIAKRLAQYRKAKAEADVLHWLRWTIAIGKLMGQGTMPAAVNPRAHVTRLLPPRDIEVLEASIVGHWGCTIIIGVGDTVASVASAIANASHPHPLPETSNVQG